MRAKDRLRARELRRIGWSLQQIAVELGAAKSGVSLWVRDLPQPFHLTLEARHAAKLAREQCVAEARAKRKAARLSMPVISGDCGRRLIRTPVGYRGSTLIRGRYVYEHRFIVEQTLGRLLQKGEVVHHKNGDIFDNRPENLAVKTRGEHSRDHGLAKTKYISLTCSTCGKHFKRPTRYYRAKLKLNQARFFCSRECVNVSLRGHSTSPHHT